MSHCNSLCAELGFFLDGTFLSNNSIVLLSDIGEGSNALFCLTDATQCCTAEAGSYRGGWRFPNGNTIFFRTTNFTRSSGLSSIRLNRESNTEGPTGIFTCRIPTNQSENNTNLYIGVYDDASEGN